MRKRLILKNIFAVLSCCILNSLASSCSYFDTASISAYVPSALCVADVKTSEFNSFSSPVALGQIDSDIAVVPVKEGIKSINDFGWPYKLERVVQGCNLYFYSPSFDSEIPITEDEKILVAESFESEYEAIEDCLGVSRDQFVIAEDVRALEEGASTLEFEGEKVFGVVMAEPYLTITFGDRVKDYVPIDELGIASQSWDYMYGVFFSDEFEDSSRSKSMLNLIDETVHDLSEDGGNQTLIEAFSLDTDECVSRFGMTPQILRKLVLKTDNEGSYSNINRLCFSSNFKSEGYQILKAFGLAQSDPAIGTYF